MIDYRLHLSTLNSFREQLALTDFGDPAIDSLRDEHVSHADAEPAFATLGCLVDHLFHHASSDGVELDLLERAAGLWQRGHALYEALSSFRGGLESALADPDDADALERLNSGTVALHGLAQHARALMDDLQALRRDVAAMPHLPPHPRQEDRDLADWNWGDVFLARHTEAFAREIRRQAFDEQTSAFALGVLASYGGNAAGSGFLTQVVGGPRRGHRFRDRLARNTVGSWVAVHDPDVPTLTTLRRRLDQAFPDGIPAGLTRAIQDSISATYDLNRVAPIPDLQMGFRRLLRHLDLLMAFDFPPEPDLPQEPFLTQLFGDPANPYQPSMPEGTGLVEAGRPPGQGPSTGVVMPQSFGEKEDGPTHSEPPDSTEVKCGAFWEAIGSSLVFLLGGWLACVIQWSDGERCDLWDNITQNWEEAFPGGVVVTVEPGSETPQALTSTGIAAVAQNEKIVQLVGDLHNLQTLMWEGFQKAREFLAVHGLLYPDGLLQRWRYRQYLVVPAVERFDWPRLPETGRRFDEYPQTGVEQPASSSFGYPAGTTPAKVTSRVPQPGTTSAADLSLRVWEQEAHGVQDSNNLDLDADRDWRHACWTAAGAITDQPIAVQVLDYDET